VDARTAGSPAAPQQTTFNMKPLMAAQMVCTMAMMAFVSLIGPISHLLSLKPWHAGTIVTFGGVLWMLLSRPWGIASDRWGRRKTLLAGISGYILSYWAMCAVLFVSMYTLPPVYLAFVGLLVTRGAVGGFYAAVPATCQALIADNVQPESRAGALASLGAANAIGLVLGPALSAALAHYSLSLPLVIIALLPVLALPAISKGVSRQALRGTEQQPSLRLSDRRLHRSTAVAFVAMFSVAVAQIAVGFFAIDRLELDSGQAARVAGTALTLVGVGLIGSQLLVQHLEWEPDRLILFGGLISAVGFGTVTLATSGALLFGGYFVAAIGMGWIFPAFSAMAANAVQAHEQGAAAGTVGAAQGLGIVLGPLGGTLLYRLGPGVPYLTIAALLLLMALWPAQAGRYKNAG